MKRLLLVLIFVGALHTWAGAAHVVDDAYPQAKAAQTAGRYDDAIKLYEQFITSHPELAAHWFDAQTGITQSLAKKGDLASAAKSVHLCLDSAPTLPAYDSAVTLAAQILSAQDKGVDRANQFLAFTQAGTGNNPMEAVGYPDLQAREVAFAAMREQAGDDAAASRLRALTYLFTGKPRDALAQFADAFRRDANLRDTGAAIDLVCLGLRAAQGHRVGLDKAMQFVIYGPSGPDGKAGTSDDLADPFAPFLTSVPPAGEGGLAGLDAASLSTLKQVHDAAELYAGDARMPMDIRQEALVAFQRANFALDDWGAPGQRDWYFRRALGLDDPLPGDRVTAFFNGAVFAARGRNTHFGDVHAMWNEVEAICAQKKITAPTGAETTRAQFEKTCTALGQVSFPAITEAPLKIPASF